MVCVCVLLVIEMRADAVLRVHCFCNFYISGCSGSLSSHSHFQKQSRSRGIVLLYLMEQIYKNQVQLGASLDFLKALQKGISLVSENIYKVRGESSNLPRDRIPFDYIKKKNAAY